MTYIAPNSTVQYFADLGLSKTDTLFFSSMSEKNDYFANIDKIATEEALSYVSRQKGVIRSSLSMKVASNIGYLRYRNTSFENFWFYAFVTNVEYTNNGLTEIYFEIDPIITYMGVFSLGECFVERQHTINDGIGDNIAEEGLDTGEYITNSVSSSGFFNDGFKIVIVYNPSSTEDSGFYVNGIYSGANMKSYETSDAANDAIKDFISNNNIDSIIAILMLPRKMVDGWALPVPTAHQVNISKNGTNIDGYIPRNNKLFCYPYNILSVSNSEGQSVDYRYEFFNREGESTTCNFSIYAMASTTPEITLVPRNYQGVNFDYDNRLSMTKFAQCAIAVDSYKAMVAQKNSNIFHDMVQTGTNVAIGAIAGNPASAISTALSGVSKISDTLISNAIRTPMPNRSLGSSAPDIMTALLAKDFYFYKKCITKNYAEMIDNYFDMFGYAVRQHITPNMNARPNWTYCKTIGCVVHGNLPASDARAIESLFNNGIRFWKKHTNIGNYNLNNKPA